MSRRAFAALALIPFPVGSAPAPPPRPSPAERNQEAVDAIRAALRAGRDVRVGLTAPPGEELTPPTPPLGTAYTLETEDEGGLMSRVVYAAEAGPALGITHRKKATIRLTMKIDAVQE